MYVRAYTNDNDDDDVCVSARRSLVSCQVECRLLYAATVLLVGLHSSWPGPGACAVCLYVCVCVMYYLAPAAQTA